MKKISLLLLLFIGLSTSAQERDFKQFSLDLNYGLSLPITPIPDGRKAGDFTAYNTIILGARYMISPKIGFKVSYSYIEFKDKNMKDNNLIYNSYDLQAVSNLAYLFGFEGGLFDKFGLLAHGGAGYSDVNPSTVSNNERVGNLIFGITPLYQLGSNIDLSFDITYLITLKQHFSFDGQLIDPNFQHVTGGFMNFSFGLVYYFGTKTSKNTIQNQ